MGNALSEADQARLLKIMASGIGNPGSEMGCYAMGPTDYDDFYDFFKKALGRYHKVDLDQKKHNNDWELKGKEGLPADGVLDVSAFGIKEPTLHANPNRQELEKIPIGRRYVRRRQEKHGTRHGPSLRCFDCQPRIRW